MKEKVLAEEAQYCETSNHSIPPFHPPTDTTTKKNPLHSDALITTLAKSEITTTPLINDTETSTKSTESTTTTYNKTFEENLMTTPPIDSSATNSNTSISQASQEDSSTNHSIYSMPSIILASISFGILIFIFGIFRNAKPIHLILQNQRINENLITSDVTISSSSPKPITKSKPAFAIIPTSKSNSFRYLTFTSTSSPTFIHTVATKLNTRTKYSSTIKHNSATTSSTIKTIASTTPSPINVKSTNFNNSTSISFQNYIKLNSTSTNPSFRSDGSSIFILSTTNSPKNLSKNNSTHLPPNFQGIQQPPTNTTVKQSETIKTHVGSASFEVKVAYESTKGQVKEKVATEIHPQSKESSNPYR